MKRLFTCLTLLIAGTMDTVTANAQSYCSSYLSSYEYITNVTFQEIDNTTDYVDGEPADYTDLGPANVSAGESYPISITLEPDADDYLTVFIDWNQNGTLDDAGEEYIIAEGTSSSGPHTIDIDVPADALPGETRMRVMLVWDDIPTPCYDAFFGYGEAEDYTVNVVAGCEAPVSVSVSAITGTSATVNWNQSGSPYGWVVLYGEAGFDPETDGMSAFTASKPYIIDDLALATAYDVYVRAICSDEDVSDWSSIADFSTLCIVPSILSTKDSSNCGAASITLEATASDGAIIKWYASLSDYEPVAIGNVYTTPVLSEAAFYYAAASGPTACENTEREAVLADILDLPVVDLGNDTFVCPGGTLTLDAGNPGSSYLWNTDATSQTITVEEMGVYSVTVTSADDCAAADVVVVGMPPVASVAGFNFIPLYDAASGTVMFTAINPLNVVSYEWDFGDGSPLSYEEAPTHTYTASGSYTVSLSVINGCEGSQVSLPISVDLPTGLVSVAEQYNETNIYPNPAKDIIHIEAKGNLVEARLYNAIGRLVRKASISSATYNMPVADLSAGIYLLQFSSGKGVVSRKVEIVR